MVCYMISIYGVQWLAQHSRDVANPHARYPGLMIWREVEHYQAYKDPVVKYSVQALVVICELDLSGQIVVSTIRCAVIHTAIAKQNAHCGKVCLRIIHCSYHNVGTCSHRNIDKLTIRSADIR